jgi:hypothetical protein
MKRQLTKLVIPAITIFLAVMAATTIFSVTAMAQSAKFTAAYSDDIDSDFVRSDACASTADMCTEMGLSANDSNEVANKIATIKMPQSKELMIGLSAQVALFTSTQVKGKRGTYSRAAAAAEGGVTLYACNEKSDPAVCYKAAPGYVTLNYRNQELEAILAGVIEDCEVDVTLTDTDGDGIPDDASGEFSLSDCDVLDEMISLGIETLSAHHFNFLLPNLPQGDYSIYTKFQTEASAEAESYCEYTYVGDDPLGCEDDDGDATGHAWAYIGKYMMTVEEVRAVKDENGDPEVYIEP